MISENKYHLIWYYAGDPVRVRTIADHAVIKTVIILKWQGFSVNGFFAQIVAGQLFFGMLSGTVYDKLSVVQDILVYDRQYMLQENSGMED